MNPTPEASSPVSAPDVPQDRGSFRPLRTWPALILVAIGILARFGPAWLEGGSGMSSYWMVSLLGPVLASLLLLIWWLTLSRATGKERLWGFVGLLAILGITVGLVDPSMRGPGTIQLTVPMGMAAFALGAVALGGRRPRVRTGLAVLFAVVGSGFSLLLRNEGATGDYALGLHWRWLPSPEESMLVVRQGEGDAKPVALDPIRLSRVLANPEWPAFRGADRNSRSRAARILTNWTTNPPRQLWKIQVGPAWSSFAVAGNLLFTQEQRGPMETVVCLDADTGREIWKQQVEARFDDPLGGPGPRATPTLSKHGLFVTGATGIFLCLNPATGDIVGKQDLKLIAGREAPPWGFCASPLVVGSVVIVYTGGAEDKGLIAMEVASGAVRWSAAAGNDSYSSPQFNVIAGEELVLMLSNRGLLFLEPGEGRVRLNYEWKFMDYRALQPLVIDDTVLLPTGMNAGTRAIRISKTNGQLAAKELWTSRNLKPDFTDLVSYQGHVYGIDGGIFTCVDLATGERKWKGGRYGKGQGLLLEESGLLLVAAESGQVVLLKADPDGHAEVGSFKALEGKTWNHPVVVHDRLYVRNSQEAACYQLILAESESTRSANRQP